jgi:predicted dienelactone hydrolase
MFLRKAILGILLAGVILVGLLERLGVAAFTWFQGEITAAPVDQDYGEARYGVKGTRPVGVRELALGGEAGIDLTLWYPALSVSGKPSSATYPYELKIFGSRGAFALAASKGQAFRNAPYDLPAAPYPLVVLSPGFAIGGKSYGWLAEHLASYGFVVISPEHKETLDPTLLWRSTVSRPQELLATLDYIDEQLQPGGALVGLINTELLAVIGHSYGGFTALAIGGARLDTAGLDDIRRTAFAANDSILFLRDALVPYISDMAELAGLNTIPGYLWPAWNDPRVDAVVSMAGDAVMFGREGLAEITIPVMAIGGTADRDSPYRWGTHLTYESISSAKKVEIALNDANHFIFTGSCDVLRRLVKLVPNNFCSDPVWDRGRAHLLIGHFVTAFLLAEVNQDSKAAALLKGNFSVPGVTFRSQGYTSAFRTRAK